MAKQTIDKLKSWFKTALKPTQQQFWDWMDSYWHKDEKITIENVDGLTDIVNNTASATVLNTVSLTLNEHLNNTENPHNVTKEQVGLGLADNTSDADKPLSNAALSFFDSITATLDSKLTIGGDALGAPIELGSKDVQPVVFKIGDAEILKLDTDGNLKFLNANGFYNGYGIKVNSLQSAWGVTCTGTDFANSVASGGTHRWLIGVSEWMRLNTNGVLQLQTLKGTGNRMVMTDTNGNLVNLAGIASGEKVITQTSAGIQNTTDILDINPSVSQFNSLASADWSTGTASVGGTQGQTGYSNGFKYYCFATNSWVREVYNSTKIDIMLPDVDDSVADKTSMELNTLYPSASIRQEVYGANNKYTKKTTTLWIKEKINYA